MGLELVEFVMSVEERFGVDTADEDVVHIETVGEFHQLVQTKLGVNETPPAVFTPRATSSPTPEALLELMKHLPAWPPPHRPI